MVGPSNVDLDQDEDEHTDDLISDDEYDQKVTDEESYPD